MILQFPVKPTIFIIVKIILISRSVDRQRYEIHTIKERKQVPRRRELAWVFKAPLLFRTEPLPQLFDLMTVLKGRLHGFRTRGGGYGGRHGSPVGCLEVLASKSKPFFLVSLNQHQAFLLAPAGRSNALCGGSGAGLRSCHKGR
ncbi:hypothetical protein ES288_A08G190900v1 [Gossypium darwinii]|uniref:Uncharacterized protein n=1 Tax=Gossypium darwinii TaxID=34276 RepID=A0A5D2FLV6_GOSDA|nr:hypothetical protein ES288_A08G190900v1 [Gossypium darwinii]